MFVAAITAFAPEKLISAEVQHKYLVNLDSNGHYGDPSAGCMADEKAVQITGVAGDVCTPACAGTTCPSDVPSGVTATPVCALQDPTGNKYCILECTPGQKNDAQCGTATCKSVQGVGICTYDDTVASEDITFDEYIARHGKKYSAEERAARKATFDWAKKVVLAHNKAYEAGAESWYMTLNELADHTPEEFAKLRATKYNPSTFPTAHLSASSKANPATMDWREKGAVTPVKNQGGCGSCWAFSATETVESHYQIASGKLLTLAPQTFVNCVKNPQHCGGTGGCEGATMELAFNLTKTTGMALESDLPYKGRDETCTAYPPAVKATGYVKLPVNDASALETAIATKGPIAITVSAEPWQLYGGGVFKGCSSGLFKDNTLDHGVQAVGYTADYWIVRNSWGGMWGEKGYIRISRANDAKTFVDKKPADGVACDPAPKTQTVGGECGILFDTSYPTGVTAA